MESAEAFLRVFLQLAAPFASMFQEVWDYFDPATNAESDRDHLRSFWV